MYFNKIWFLACLCTKLSIFLRIPARGAAGLKLAYEKPLLIVNVFSDFPTGNALCVLHG